MSLRFGDRGGRIGGTKLLDLLQFGLFQHAMDVELMLLDVVRQMLLDRDWAQFAFFSNLFDRLSRLEHRHTDLLRT